MTDIVENSTELEEVGNIVEGDLSLADLANLDTSDMAIVMSRLPMEGLWTVRGKSVALGKSDPKEEGQMPLFRIGFKFESIKIEPTNPPEDFDPAKTVGRKLSDSTTLWPDAFQQEIGIIRGKYKRVGLPSDGKLGGMEGNPGWLNNIEDAIFVLKVRHAEVKGESKAFIDWVGPVDDDEGIDA